MFKTKNLTAIFLLTLGLAFTSCSEDTVLDDMDGSQLTQPYDTDQGKPGDTPPGG